MKSLYVLRTASRAPSAGAFFVDGAARVPAGCSSGKVGLQTVAAALPAVARLLVAPERAGRIELVERVRPDDAGAHLVGDGEDAGALLGPDARGQPVRGVVRLLNRLRRG